MSEIVSEMLETRAVAVAERLSLMANPKRLMILCRLAEGEQSVGALHGNLDLSQSALSQHLARLREAGIVATRRDGTSIYYSLSDPDTKAVMAALYEIFCKET
ncbi:ArsR family transcriptional regulator [Palleronia aestuarii]|uniref:ArsR family transcriptional regulator n=1 Tax=Palleronia aestuarii TaxID=568105 RepID=A0A2W7NLF5_9RHOB|nr:metalloregulator ArsR/SmtB family transcription factor [Palleronia aestuarii]PZX18937.1 ArsR family transcriptional regulator [Palleronia aestuarii]